MSGPAPSPPGLPLVGNAVQYLRDPLSFHERYVREHGDVVRVDLAGRSFHYVTHPEAVRRVLVDDHDRYRKASAISDTASGFAADGLFLAEGEQWRRLRTLSQPAFYREAVESYVDVAVEHARDLAAGWTDGQRVAVDEAAKELTLGVLTRALFGVDVREDRETGRVVRRAARAVNDRMDATRLSTLLPWMPTLRERRFRSAVAEFDATVDALVEARRGDLDAHDDLLTHFVHAREDGDLTLRELRDQLVTFLFAGHETTSLALTYTLWHLAHHPEAETRLHAELDAVLGERDPTATDLPSLTYTDHVLSESLRLLPPVYMVLREPTEDVRLRGVEVPAGSTLVLPQRVVQTDPRWWDDPREFRPERWAEDDPDRPEYAYFPFGGGPRHCIGMRFATLELRAALATLARRVRFSDPSADLSLSLAVTLEPEDPVEMTVEERAPDRP